MGLPVTGEIDGGGAMMAEEDGGRAKQVLGWGGNARVVKVRM